MLNHQGDVIALMKSDYTIVARYIYNAWGEIIDVVDSSYASITSSTNIALVNPLRYRGYYYDTETGFYYLQSRYYDPVSHRFINADGTPSTGQDISGTNMFAYCGNNPVARADDGGEFWHIVVGAVVGAVIGAVAEIASEALEYVATGDPIDWGDVATEAVGGAIYGGIVVGTGNTTIASAASNVTTTVINGFRAGDSVGEIALKAAGSAAISFAPKAVSKLVGGKYAKLNRIEKLAKRFTDGPYVGKFLNRESVQLVDSFIWSGKRACKHIVVETIKLGLSPLWE